MALMQSISQLAALRPLLRHPRATRAEIVAYQDQQLQRLVTHAATNVPFYRRRFAEAGIDVARIHSVGHLAALPITTRDELRGAGVADTIAAGVDPDALLVR